MSEKLRKFRLDDDGESPKGKKARDNKGDKNRAREMKRAGEVLPVEQPLSAESVAEGLPQEPAAGEAMPEVAPQEEKLPEIHDVSGLAEIYGDKTPPTSVAEIFNKLRGKKREDYVAMLRGRMAEEAQRKAVISQRHQKKTKGEEPNGFSRAEIDAIAQETLDRINDFKAGVDTRDMYAPQYGQGEPAHLDEEPIGESVPSVFRSGRREVESEVELPVLTDVVPEAAEEETQFIRDTEVPEYIEEGFKNEATAKENREKFLDVMAQAKEKLGGGVEQMKTYLSGRSVELDVEAKKIGWEDRFRKLGEKYNKLPTWQKVALGGSLAVGYGLTMPLSTWAALAYAAPLVATRFAAMAGSFERNEKLLESINKGEAKGRLANTRFYKWLGSGSEESIKNKAMAKAMVQSFGMTIGLAYTAHELAEHHVAERLGQWISEHMSAGTSGKEAVSAVRPTAAAAAGEVAPALSMHEMPTVGASSHGYEGMMKNLWHELQDKHVTLPTNADPNSDLARLLGAHDEHSLNTIVHQIASDPHHGFFNPDGTSVSIDPSAHMTIGTDGQVHFGMGDAAHHIDVVQATPEMEAHVTPAYYPEAPAVEVAAPTESFPPFEMQPVGLTDTEVDKILSSSPSAPVEHMNAPIIDHSSFHNIFNLDVPVAEAHIYTDPGGKHLFVYGGSPKEKMDMITTFLTRNPDKVIFSSDVSGANRIPWHVVGKEVVPDAPIQTGLFFKTFMKAPNPNEFQKVIL